MDSNGLKPIVLPSSCETSELARVRGAYSEVARSGVGTSESHDNLMSSVKRERIEKREERVPPVETSLTRLYPLKLLSELNGSGAEGSESVDGANWSKCVLQLQLPTHYLHVTFNHTPKVATPDFDRVASCQTASLQVTAQFVEDGLFQVAKYSNSRKKVVEVRMKRI